MAKKTPPKIVREIQKYNPPPINFSTEKIISYSQVSMYWQCPKKWALQYRDGHKVFDPNIYLVFGTALHEVLQDYLEVMYNESGVKADKMELELLFEEKLKDSYKTYYKKNNSQHFTDPSKLGEFYSDGVDIINYIRKNRGKYFSKRNWWLVGCEIPINVVPNSKYPHVKFIGYIDVLLYNKNTESFYILDIKTSTKGWGASQKKDKHKQYQLVLYKKFLSQQYNIPLDKINIEFFITRRKTWETDSYSVKHVQSFKPSSGKVSINKATKKLNEFVENCFTPHGYTEKDMGETPNDMCKWCPFYKTYLCKSTFT